ncbi:Sulf1 [Gossypium arboreum]|uniref:Sulf1 n=1 Tax=Gossypium arboreum TaxID=29729 RepID=A0A0B0PBX4_GOSAR|nr:Sulf1 [Gossypium arboreum]KHG22400.1 Sulf1 [Gossypium arboreum]
MPDSNKNQALDNIKRFALEVSDNYVKKAIGKKWRDHKSTLKKEYISLEEKLQNVLSGMLRIVSELELQVGKNKNSRTQLGRKEKLKDKRAEYETIASSDSSVNLDDIDNRIIIEVLGLERYGQMAQMQASTVEQIAQLKAEAESREAEAQRKYDEL